MRARWPHNSETKPSASHCCRCQTTLIQTSGRTNTPSPHEHFQTQKPRPESPSLPTYRRRQHPPLPNNEPNTVPDPSSRIPRPESSATERIVTGGALPVIRGHFASAGPLSVFVLMHRIHEEDSSHSIHCIVHLDRARRCRFARNLNP